MSTFTDRSIKASDITPREVFEGRRSLIKTAAAGGFGLALAPWFSRDALATATTTQKLQATKNPSFSASDGITNYKDVTTYNNFYEFSGQKSDPADLAHTLQTRPWTVSVEGLVKKPGTFGIEELLKLAPMEERIYRMRCVEGWSMVIPWDGYSLSKLLKKVEPLGSAKYVEFISLADPKQMPALRYRTLQWPYREGLRLDEAMNPLTLLTFGLYGEILPNQNGAPVRIVVPWKYGFKSAKSIVKIRLTEEQPQTSWNMAIPREYGFYSNVNPKVPHPRWTQSTERPIGKGNGLFPSRVNTLMFNGYEEQVASMYSGMDLKKYY
jgi:sulfoxide reductase catalytic subunit YedY